jgi:hypothetical protein
MSDVDGVRAGRRLSGWRPPRFTWRMRGQPGPVAPTEQWEAVLRAERSPGLAVLTLAARNRFARAVLRLPAEVGEAQGGLEERAARLASARASWAGRLLIRGLPAAAPTRGGGNESGLQPPRIGPVLGEEIDDALALLGSMPFEELQRRGWHVQPNHFYWPLNDVSFLHENPGLWTGERPPRGVDLDIDGQAELARRLAKHAGELSDVPEGRARRGEPVFRGRFSRLDAYLYYGLVRELQPSRVIEVGTGMSSNFLALAIARNRKPCDVTLIDPEIAWLVGDPRPGERHIRSMVQDVGLERFDELRAGDIMFYDGSHCVRTASDVNRVFFEILPRLAAGVWIHVHDIFWPLDYPEQWVLGEGLSWNEQYLLQAFLMHNDAYRVRVGSVALLHHARPLAESLFPGDLDGATSLWIEKLA